MGTITGYNQNNFKSAEYIYSKIKREFSSFGFVNLIDDSDFPLYTSEVLKKLGNSSYKEGEAITKVKDGKAHLPEDFMQLYAAYKCHHCDYENDLLLLQNRNVYLNKIECNVLCRKNDCFLECQDTDKLLERVIVRQYVKDGTLTHTYRHPTLLKLSPNVKQHCSEDCLNLLNENHNNRHGHHDEISINNRCIYTNFHDGDIYLQYYAFPQDDNGLPLVPDIIEVEKAIESYIKWQLLLSWWITGAVSDIIQKVQYYEAEYEKWMAEARYIGKLPAFSTMVNSIRNQRGLNMVTFFSQQDRNRR